MIYSESYHDSQQEAEQEGQDFCEAWGRAYSPTYYVFLSNAGWICKCTRWNSCD